MHMHNTTQGRETAWVSRRAGAGVHKISASINTQSIWVRIYTVVWEKAQQFERQAGYIWVQMERFEVIHNKYTINHEIIHLTWKATLEKPPYTGFHLLRACVSFHGYNMDWLMLKVCVFTEVYMVRHVALC